MGVVMYEGITSRREGEWEGREGSTLGQHRTRQLIDNVSRRLPRCCDIVEVPQGGDGRI